jgi:AcrR family transcriptional regulator
VRQRAPRGEGGRLRDELLSAAVGLLAETGDPAAVTVRGVAARVGVSPNAIYLHFTDREDLVAEAVAMSFQGFIHTIQRVVDDDHSPLEALHLAHRRFMEFAAANRGAYRSMFGGESLSPDREDINRRLSEIAYPAFQLLQSIVKRCMDAGDLPRMSSFALARLIFVAEHGWADMAGTPRGAVLTESDDILDIILRLAQGGGQSEEDATVGTD